MAMIPTKRSDAHLSTVFP